MCPHSTVLKEQEVPELYNKAALESVNYYHGECVCVCMQRYQTSEVFHFEVFRAGLLAQQGGIEHNFSLSFDALIELPHCHVT